MLAFGLLLSTIIHTVSSQVNCSALHSYVYLFADCLACTEPHLDTLTSSQALFPPYTYYVPSTDLAISSINDDICNSNITSNISNRIVLLFESIGTCSIHSKVVTAQQNGAIAVLIANNDYSGIVVSIADDDTLSDIETSIPMRSISTNDGERLHDYVTSDYTVKIEFGCFGDTTYPSTLCLSDTLGSMSQYHTFHPLSGEYQRQFDISVNGHPVWKLPGYAGWAHHLYMFLHDASGDHDWYWAITADDTFTDDDMMWLRCSYGDITLPSLCPFWADWGDNGTYTAGTNELRIISGIDVRGDVCLKANHTASTICIQSTQSELAGLRGTWRLGWYGEPDWMRDLNECDQRAGVMMFHEYDGYGWFTLHEVFSFWLQSQCRVPDELGTNGLYDTVKFRPDLCTEWRSRDDYDYSKMLNLPYDDTFSITIGECTDSALCVASEAPQYLCMTNNSVMRGGLMGEYIKLNETGPYFASAIYKRDPPINVAWLNQTLYIWYANEYYAKLGWGDYLHTRLWVLSSHDLEEALQRATNGEKYEENGYCHGYAYGNPGNCVGWTFPIDWQYFWDEDLSVTPRQCSQNLIWPSIPESWPQYICIGLKNESFPWSGTMSWLHKEELMGAFELQSTYLFPTWFKIHNDLEPDDMYLWYNTDNKWGLKWQIRTATEYVLSMCDPYTKSKSVNPIECGIWFDDDGHEMDNIYLYECSVDDIMTASPTSSPTPTPKRICLNRNGTIQSLLEGVYEETEQMFVYDNIYLWYNDGEWILTPDPLDIGVYGYCPGGVDGCTECWIFYWTLYVDKWIQDCSFQLSMDLSVCQLYDGYRAELAGSIQYNDVLCVDRVDTDDILHDDGHNYHTDYQDIKDVPIDLTPYFGEYALESSNGVYRHILNADITVTHDVVSNHWLIELSGDLTMLCHERSGKHVVGKPVHCRVWDENDETSHFVDNFLDMHVECGKSEAKKTGLTAGAVVAIVFGIIMVLICIGGVMYWWFKLRKDKAQKRRDIAEQEMIQKSEFVTSDKHEMIATKEDDEDDDLVDEDDREAADPLTTP